MSNETLSRRSFLKQVAAVSAGVALTGVALSSPQEAQAKAKSTGVITPNYPKGKVRVACVGVGARGREVVKGLHATGLCDIVILCDTDMGTEPTAIAEALCPKAKKFQDFREMFDKASNEFDAVAVATPDHAHFPITMLAMMSGKHVYVEKPLARTFEECELLMAAEKKYGVVTQMGNQGHSGDNYYQFKSFKEKGVLKDVRSITAHMNNVRRWHKWDPNMQSFPAADPMPSTLDWDTWLGTRAFHEYNKDFDRGQWRCWYDFGMGTLGDWGAHLIDTLHEFLELGLPTEINPSYLKDHNPFFYPMSSSIDFKFAARKDMPECIINWKDGLDNLPTLPAGYGDAVVDKDIPTVAGEAFVPTTLPPGRVVYADGLILKGGSHGTPLSIVSGERGNDFKKYVDDYVKEQPDCFTDFLVACQGKGKTNSPFSVSGPLSQVFCLGVISQRLNTKLIFDPATKTVTNNSLANEMLRGSLPRAGWEKYYQI